MTGTKTKYQRAEYRFTSGQWIEKIEITRESDKCYWVMEQSWRGIPKEARRVKASAPPLFDTWHEAHDDLMAYLSKKERQAKDRHQEALQDMLEVAALTEPES